jgi:ABC-type multidrug transport system fused ATPase/permease subunit
MEYDDSHKPVEFEEKTLRLQQIVSEFYPDTLGRAAISDTDYKKADLLRRMRDDADMLAYPKLITILMISILVSTFTVFLFQRSWLILIISVLGLLVILSVRYWLKEETLRQLRYKDNFELYVWEGLKLKQSRQTSVQALYLVIFPVIMIQFAIAFETVGIGIQYWKEYFLAIAISTLTWWYVFRDDRKQLLNWKRELLELLPFNPDQPGF